MISKTCFQALAMTCLLCTMQPCFAQLGQIGGGGNAGGAAGAGATGSSTAAGLGATNTGGTTQGLGGVTTQGVPQGDQTGGTAGGNVAEAFVGGNNTGGFVGGGVQTQQNSNRQFSAITNRDVATGGSAQATGTPRRVPVSLKVAFPSPPPLLASELIGPTTPVVQQVAIRRPEFASVAVEVMPDGTAVLTGFAADVDARRLAANLVRLNPGVRRIDNRLVISAP